MLRCTIIGNGRKLVYIKTPAPLWSSWIFLHFLFVTKTQLQVFSPALTCLVTERRRELEPKPRFLHNPWGRLQRMYLLLLEWSGERERERERWREREIHGPIPGRQCPKASCYSHSGNVSAFNGIVNRNAFPRGSEEDWHCCSDCYTPNSEVSHINIPILPQSHCLHTHTHTSACIYTHTRNLHL